MWANGTLEMQQTYGKAYLNSLLDGQSDAMKTSAKTCDPVTDALVEALRRSRPGTRYIVDGSCKLFDRGTVSFVCLQYNSLYKGQSKHCGTFDVTPKLML